MSVDARRRSHVQIDPPSRRRIGAPQLPHPITCAAAVLPPDARAVLPDLPDVPHPALTPRHPAVVTGAQPDNRIGTLPSARPNPAVAFELHTREVDPLVLIADVRHPAHPAQFVPAHVGVDRGRPRIDLERVVVEDKIVPEGVGVKLWTILQPLAGGGVPLPAPMPLPRSAVVDVGTIRGGERQDVELVPFP